MRRSATLRGSSGYIAPADLRSLVAGIAGAGHLRIVGRMGFRAIVYFEIVTTLALVIGLLAVNVTRPGDGLDLPTGASEIKATPKTWGEILTHTVPTSVLQAMAENDVLQIVFFAIMFAIALNILGEKGRPVVALCEVITETMFKMTNIVMRYAPIGVGAASRTPRSPAWGASGTCHAVGRSTRAAGVHLLVLRPIALLLKVPLRKFVRAIRSGGDSLLDDLQRGRAAAGHGGPRAPRSPRRS